jgi:Kef-type K+ transport system membrane component KefB
MSNSVPILVLAERIPAPDLRSLVLVLAASSMAAILGRIDRRVVLPSIVLEILFGVLLGPQALGLAHADAYLAFLGELGLALLFFFAGVEVIQRKVAPALLARGSVAWAVSLGLGIAVGYVLQDAGLGAKGWLLGIALSTTSLGMLVPILSDADMIATPLGKSVLGVGVAGEFWPIIVISVALTGAYGAGTELILLVAFGAAAFAAAVITMRARPPRILEIFRETLDSTSLAAVRLTLLVLAILVLVARDVGFDFILGAFTAGLVIGLGLDSPNGQSVRTRLEGIGYGFLVPIYFVTTGLTFDLDGLLSTRGLLCTSMFVALLLLVHSASAVVLGRPHTARRTTSLAFFAATGLPLIVATVSIGITRGAIGPDVGASLIGAGMVSVLLFPIIAMRIERPRTVERFSDAGNGRGRTNRLRRDPGKRPALRPL